MTTKTHSQTHTDGACIWTVYPYCGLDVEKGGRYSETSCDKQHKHPAEGFDGDTYCRYCKKRTIHRFGT